jgi:hypothetical protein
MALTILSLPSAERCERPTGAPFSASILHAGLLLHGPELKFGFCIINILKINFKKLIIYISIEIFTQEILAYFLPGETSCADENFQNSSIGKK